MMCLFQSGNSPTTLTMCGARTDNFEALIQHLNQAHNLNLKPGVDYCCDEIFPGSLTASLHYMDHLLDLVDIVSFNGPNELNRVLLAPLQTFLRDEKKRLSHHVYEEQMELDENSKHAAEAFENLMEETIEEIVISDSE